MNWDFVGWTSSVLWPTEGALGLLFLMCIWSVTIAARQSVTFHAYRKEYRSLLEYIYAALGNGRIREALSVAQKNNAAKAKKRSGALHLGPFEEQPVLIGDAELFDSIRELLESPGQVMQPRLRNGQNWLATISATAPFVGFFGTVLHLIAADHGCGAQKATCLAAIASAVGDSLWVAVLGMAIGFLALCSSKYFNGRIESFAVETETSSLKLHTALVLSRKAGKGSNVGSELPQTAVESGIAFDGEAWLRSIKKKTLLIALVFSAACLAYALRPTRQPSQGGPGEFYLPLEVESSADDQSLFSFSQCRANVAISGEWNYRMYTVDRKGGRWPFGCYNLTPGGYYYFARWVSDDHSAMSIGVLKWSQRRAPSGDFVEAKDLNSIGIWTVRLPAPE